MAYIDMTLRMMEQFGVKAEKRGGDCFHMEAGQSYRHQEYAIEPDVSAACYFYGMAAILGIEVLVPGVHFGSLQGDVQFLRILERMGCSLHETAEGIALEGTGNGRLRGRGSGVWHACSDQAITLAAIAPFVRCACHHNRHRTYPVSGKQPYGSDFHGAGAAGNPL